MSNNQSTPKTSWRSVSIAAAKISERFRKLVENERYYEYVLAILFWKYISDLWRSELDPFSKTNDELKLREKISSARFFIPPGASFYDILKQKDDPKLGLQISLALEKISYANIGKLGGVFQTTNFTSEEQLGPFERHGRLLKVLMEGFSSEELDMSPQRISDKKIGNMFLFLLMVIFSDRKNSRVAHYTNADLSSLIAVLANPESRNSICDPFCGTGSLLMRMTHLVEVQDTNLFGFEKKPSVWALAKLNMLFHGYDDSQILLGDSLNITSSDSSKNDRNFDRVVANPPAEGNVRMIGSAFLSRFHPMFCPNWCSESFDQSENLVSLDYLIRITKPKTGRLVVVVPSSILFRKRVEWVFREKLIETNILDAVVSLPDGLITGSQTSNLLIVDRSREKGGTNFDRKDVLFIDAKEIFDDSRGFNNSDSSYIHALARIYFNRSVVSKVAYRATPSEIIQNNFDLMVARYVNLQIPDTSTLMHQEAMKIASLKREIGSLNLRINSKMRSLRGSKPLK